MAEITEGESGAAGAGKTGTHRPDLLQTMAEAGGQPRNHPLMADVPCPGPADGGT
jgi:hypothetical protein